MRQLTRGAPLESGSCGHVQEELSLARGVGREIDLVWTESGKVPTSSGVIERGCQAELRQTPVPD
jgi:hypothetical protein